MNTIDTVSIPAHIEGDYAINANGDAMAPGILHGDLLVARKAETFEDGWVVIAIVGDEGMARRYGRVGATVHLTADNPTVEDLEVPAAGVTLLGRVVGLYRSLA